MLLSVSLISVNLLADEVVFSVHVPGVLRAIFLAAAAIGVGVLIRLLS
ncbi:MAG: hypothetical protein K2Y37_04200 [Pirellulales bacterium]|nr:hypothetical protein [Pirellulales bacterium]